MNLGATAGPENVAARSSFDVVLSSEDNPALLIAASGRRLQLGPVDDSFRRPAGPAPPDESSARRPDAHVDTRQLPALGPIEEIHIGCQQELYTGCIDKPAMKNIAGQGDVVVPPFRPPHHLRVGSQTDFGLSQCRVRMLDEGNGAAHSDEDSGHRRVSAVYVPAHDDVADSADLRTRGVPDGTTKNTGERDHPTGNGRTEGEVPVRRGPRSKAILRSAVKPTHGMCSMSRRPKSPRHQGLSTQLSPSGNTASTGRRPRSPSRWRRLPRPETPWRS